MKNINDILELLGSAQCNFDNLVTMAPPLAQHPMYVIARKQLDEAVKQLEHPTPDKNEEEG